VISIKVSRACLPQETLEFAAFDIRSQAVDTANRRLIRPSLEAAKEQGSARRSPKQKSSPPEQTHAENFYYLKQMQAKTPMVLVLEDGETIHGQIEWYDKSCLKINREDGPNLLVYKSGIKYMYKA
jgi:sRNA-binding regulator protein Hfq